MTNEPYHLPVLLHESVEGLDIQPKGNYVDVTFGGGGHSKAILEKLGEEGKLIAFDHDADAAQIGQSDDCALAIDRADVPVAVVLRTVNATTSCPEFQNGTP